MRCQSRSSVKPAKSDGATPAILKRAAFLGLALAGGKSQRMGRDKGSLKPWGDSGPTMLERAHALLAAITPRVVVSLGADASPIPGYETVFDSSATEGPARGIAAGLRKAKEFGLAGVLTLPCDSPRQIKEDLEILLLAHRRDRWLTCFVNEVTGRLETLTAIYDTSFLPVLEHGLACGRASLYWLIPEAKRLCLPYGAPLESCFLNCNTPADLLKI